MGKRITPWNEDAMLEAYERGLAKGKNKKELLSKLGKSYGRSERQIERYIQRARERREAKQQEQAVGVSVVIDDKPRLLLAHHEAIKEAIKLWIEKQRPASDEELLGFRRGKMEAWGITAEIRSDGGGKAEPAMGRNPLYEALRAHLVPPAGSQDFWDKAAMLVSLGLNFLTSAVNTYSELVKTAQERCGLDITREIWQQQPVMGLTQDFVQTVYERALGIGQSTIWAHSAWGVVWPNTGGLVITSVNEGMQLRLYNRYDASITETRWVLVGESLMLPTHSRERVAYGDADLNSPGMVAFLLCFGAKAIALTASPDQLAVCEQAHRDLIRDCTTCEKTTKLIRARASLDSLNREVLTALERARYQPSFPGICPLCP